MKDNNDYNGLKRLVPDLSSAWVSFEYSSYLPQLPQTRIGTSGLESVSRQIKRNKSLNTNVYVWLNVR